LIVIPGRAKREPGIHIPRLWLWIPGLRLSAHPGMTMLEIKAGLPTEHARLERLPRKG
jgi:hypothetical protein